jgi:tRNA (cytidine56-2'-O)-methyltransferase
MLVIVGSQKVPAAFFSKAVSDFNVAIGNQPHSECSSLAVFLDRFFGGNTLTMEFDGTKMRIVPMQHGKKVVSIKT